MSSFTHANLVDMAKRRAHLSDLEDQPLPCSGELWEAAQVELLLLLAEIENPTAIGRTERREAVLKMAACMLRVSRSVREQDQ